MSLFLNNALLISKPSFEGQKNTHTSSVAGVGLLGFLIGTKIFEGIQYISNDHYDKECSSVIKSSSIFEKASCYNKVKYGCRIIHEIELDHKFLGTDIKCCWGIKINREVKTSKFNLRIFNNTCIVLI